jgi:uncharacterized protein (DUF2141 family)
MREQQKRSSLLHTSGSEAVTAARSVIEPLEGRILMSTVYSAFSGFSATKNPNGPWAFGYTRTETSAFVPFNKTVYGGVEWTSVGVGSSNTPSISKNSGATYTIGAGYIPWPGGTLYGAPGFPNGVYTVTQFTAPATGSYTVATSAAGMQTIGDSANIHIMVGGKSLYDANVTGSGTYVNKTLTLANVAKGTTIDFSIGENNSGASDDTIFTETITQAPTPTGKISGTVFSDTNANGKLDTGEKGLAGETVYIDTQKTGAFATGDPTAVTSSTGAYSFTSLAAGTYIVREKLPAGYKLTSPATGDFSVTLTNGQSVTGDNFADAPVLASISGTVFNDANANGKKDPGEEGLGLWTLYIDLKKDGKDDAGDPTVTTNILGAWSFTGLAPGTYIVRVVPVTGSVATTPTGGVKTITLTAGQSSVGNLFGEKTTA